jgi:hypothetical protein
MIKEMHPIEEIPVSHQNYKVHVRHGYRAILGHDVDVDPEDLNANVKSLEAGGTLLQFCQGLANSDEFKNNRQHLPAKDLAEGLYQEILKRPADLGGLEGTMNAIKEGRIAQRAADMLNSQEFFDRFQ